MKLTEIDPESGAEVFQLTDDPRPADDIYGEQPYSDPSSRFIAVRFYPDGDRKGDLAVLDLSNGDVRTMVAGGAGFPAFHAWSDYLYCQQTVGNEIVLRRWRYDTLEREDVLVLPRGVGSYSYGTTSPDHKLYAVSVVRPDESRCVMVFDLASGESRTVAESAGKYHFKHEQFSRDGMNRVLIQADVRHTTEIGNPDWEVHLGWIDVNRGGMTRFTADKPYTPPPTGHECWIGATDHVCFSTLWRGEDTPTMYSAGVGDTEARTLHVDRNRWLCHVSVSACGRYWIADGTEEEHIPIYAGAFGGRVRRLIMSRTEGDGKQWCHTHPYLTADNRWLIFTSRRDGLPQVYGARVPAEFWESLTK